MDEAAEARSVGGRVEAGLCAICMLASYPDEGEARVVVCQQWRGGRPRRRGTQSFLDGHRELGARAAGFRMLALATWARFAALSSGGCATRARAPAGGRL